MVNQRLCISDILLMANIPHHDTGQIHMNCVFCNDTRKRLYIHMDKGVFCCHNCGESGGINDFASLLGVSDLNDFASLQGNNKRYRRNSSFNDLKTSSLRMPEISEVSLVYNCLLDLTTLREQHRTDLLNRGYSKQAIVRRRFRSTPTKAEAKIIIERLVTSGHNLLGIPGFYMEHGKFVLDTRFQGYYIPVREVNGEIRSLLIRADGNSQSKYLSLSSSFKSEQSGCGISNVKDYIGNYHISGSPASKVLVVSEGILKSDISQYLLKKRYTKQTFFSIGFPGAASTKSITPLLEKYADNNYTYILDGYDKDRFTNPNVKTAHHKLFKSIREFYDKNGLSFPQIIHPAEKWYLENGLDDTLYLKLQKKVGIL